MSKLKDEVDLLQSIPMFSNVPQNKLKLLAFASDRMTFEEGQNLFLQGDAADAAYVIIEGKADVLVGTDKDETSVATLERNAFVGDMAVLSDIARTATVRATEHMEVLRIKKEHMMEMVLTTPSLTLAVLQTLVDRLAKTTLDLSEARLELKKKTA